MENPNISLLGATYSGVSGVTLPKQGGGTATFPWVEGSQTVTQNGTVDVTNLAEVVVNVSGGGGASNVVTGTFKGTTTGSVLSITLPYTGSGYPVAVIVYPSEGGYNSSGTFYQTIQRYAICEYYAVKSESESVPDYTSSNTKNNSHVRVVFKNSTSVSSSMTSSGHTGQRIYRDDTNPSTSSTATLTLMFWSKTIMKVLIASTSYGFMENVEYRYAVIYSS